MTGFDDQLDRNYAPAWRPEPDERLVGEVVELSQRVGYQGDLYAIITVREEDGREWAIHAFHSVLANEFAKLRPRVGERIAVKYAGQRETRDGRSKYHSYRLAVNRPQTFDWEAVGGDANGDTQEPDVPTDPVEPPPETPPASDDLDDVPF